MRVPLRHVAVAVLAWTIAAVYLFVSPPVSAGLTTAGVLWLVLRIEVKENPRHDIPGHWVVATGRVALLRLAILVVLWGIGIWAAASLDMDRLTSEGAIAAWALIGCALLLYGEMERSGDIAANFLHGGRAEQKVGASLDQLKQRGWEILHSYKREGAGDIDHMAIGPNGVYAIETKSYGLRTRDLGRVRWNAVWLKEYLDARWVTGVLCVADDIAPRLQDRVWVMGHDHLVPWLLEQRNSTVPRERVREALLGVEALVGGPA